MTLDADVPAGRLRRPEPEPGRPAPPAGHGEVRVGDRLVGVRYVPPAGARRLVVLLHGAGATAQAGLRLLLPYADAHHLMLYAPQSAGRTWDVIRDGYGPDVRRLQQALDEIWAVRPDLADAPVIGGFSDGASYALSLGLTNGDLFDAVVAFSPGFAAPSGEADHPAFFVSHGRGDTVLPVDRCSRRVVRALRALGHPVHYHEFDGGHEVPAAVAAAAVDWLAGVPADR